MRAAPLAPEIESHLSAVAADDMEIFLLADRAYRCEILNGTRLVNQMRANHQLGIMETLILGHAYLAAGLLTGLVKGNDRIRIDISCDGQIRGLSVDANARGEIRGYLRNSHLKFDKPPESFDTSPYVGTGRLTVTRTLEGSKAPVSGHVDLTHGQLAKDLAHYFVVSEQKPTAITLSVQFDRSGQVIGAGGLFVQALPEKDESPAGGIEEVIRSLPSLGRLFADGDTPSHVINTAFRDYAPEIVGTRAIEMSCPCSRDRFEQYIRSLPPADVEEILVSASEPTEVTCHYCNSTYIYGRGDNT